MKPKKSLLPILATLAMSAMPLHAATIDLDLTSNNAGSITLSGGNNSFSFSGFEVDYLIVAGGGAGGTSGRSNTSVGGGGAGGLLQGTELAISGPQAIEVGEGGQPSTSRATAGGNGGNSEAFGLTALGGGGGGSSTLGGANARDGGSGGGMARVGSSAGSIGEGTDGQGHDGAPATSNTVAGGGGGAGAAGDGPTGGVGIETSIAGPSLTFAAGGNAGASGAVGIAGANNTGDGGGGGLNGSSANPSLGGVGGSGIVVVRYSGSQVLTGGIVSTVGGDTVHQFLDTGTSTLGFNATVAGDITGTGNLIWDGGGTLTLTGTSAFDGSTTVNASMLAILGSVQTTNLVFLNDGTIDLGSSGQLFVLASNYTLTDAQNDIDAGNIFGDIPLFVGTETIGSDEYVIFNAIPEPSTALLGGLGFLMLLRRRR